MGKHFADEMEYIRPTYDISHIPQNIIDLFLSYDAVPYHEYRDLTTPAQKRTRTMRFRKFYDACLNAKLKPETISLLLVNAKCSRQIGEW